jgi:hypothetical protein
MSPQFKVYIGYDSREAEAARVAAKTLREVTRGQIEPTFLRADRLREQGLLTRPVDDRGQRYDIVSNAPASTEFAISRFLTPILAQEGWALFVDCDVVFREDPREMLGEVSAEHAVSVVKHATGGAASGTKMDGQVQTSYARKNWSSVMLFNADHPANRRLSLRDVNERPGRDLHAFYWLHDSEIGSLAPRWNWLVNVEGECQDGIAHFTLGGPFTPGWTGAQHDDIWLEAAR